MKTPNVELRGGPAASLPQGPCGLQGSAALDDDDEAAFEEDEKARIAALHKSAPEVIWLQVDPEADQFDGWEAQTWCSDKINETDVKYVRADMTPNVELTGSRAGSSPGVQRAKALEFDSERYLHVLKHGMPHQGGNCCWYFDGQRFSTAEEAIDAAILKIKTTNTELKGAAQQRPL